MGALTSANAPAVQRYRLAEVSSKGDFEKFIRVPWTVYRGDPTFSPPLLMERRQLLSPDKNPFFEHAIAKYWLATKDGEPVGRISAQIDELAQQHMQAGTGQFGMYDVIEDQGLSDALFAEAESWLAGQGMNRALGPFNLSINGEIGLLVAGYNMPPCVLMTHAKPYYREFVEANGYDKAIDAFAYWLDITGINSRAVDKIVAWGESNPKFQIREIDKSRLRDEIDIVLDIFNDAWSDNWGFIPMTDAEIESLASELKPILYPHLSRICEFEGEPIAFMITLPDINRLTADLDGRLLPLGWAKLGYRLMRQKFTHLRVPLMGVKKAYQRTRVGGAAALLLIELIRRDAVEHGGEYGELSWILETNESMRNILTAIGSVPYKTYRIYEKALGGVDQNKGQ